MNWLEENKKPPENAPMKSPKRLQLNYDLINFTNIVVERLIDVVEKTSNKCGELYKKVLKTHN